MNSLDLKKKIDELEALGVRSSETVFKEPDGTYTAHRTYWDGAKPCFSCVIPVKVKEKT